MEFFAALYRVAVHSYKVPAIMYLLVIAALVFYALTEFKHTRHDHVIKLKEATRWSAIYIGLALAFSIPIFIFIGRQAGGEYLGAWAIEKALSLDNLFVISLIFASFKVRPEFQRRMLNYGIAGAIIFRLLFILAGFELLKSFEWISIVFGLILLRAAYKAFREARSGQELDQELEIVNSKMWKFVTSVLPVHPEFVGHKLFVRINGRRMLTMMAAVIVLIEVSDVIFAVDSVPAVLAISPDRFIAYSSNVFALLGLRALFFVYQAIADKFWALNWGLALILGWISFKMIAAPFGLNIPVLISLGVLGVLLIGSIFVSLKWQRQTD